MGDAGEGLIDAEARIQERMDELEREKTTRRKLPSVDPEKMRERESLRLTRTELQRQLDATSHDARRKPLTQALAEIDKRLDTLT